MLRRLLAAAGRASTRACSVIARPPGRISTVALCTSITPGTRSAAASARSLGCSSAASGSACTDTSAGRPSSCSTTRSTSSMTAWLRSSPASLSTPITTSAKYLPPEERTRSARTSVTPGTDATTARRFASAPAGALSISALTLERAEPHGAEDDEHGDEEGGDGIGARVAERREHEARHDRERAGEVDGEVHRVGSERGAALAARGARRGGGARGVDHEHDREQGHRVPGRPHLSPAAAEAHDRRDRDPGREPARGSRPRRAPRGSAPCRGRTDAADLPGGRRRRRPTA